MSDSLDVSWPVARLGDAVDALATELGVAPAEHYCGPTPDPGGDPDAVDRWLLHVEAYFELEFRRQAPSLSQLPRMLKQQLPVLAVFGTETDHVRIAVIVAARGGRLELRTPGGKRVLVASRQVERWLSQAAIHDARAQVEPLLQEAGVPPTRRSKARDALLVEWTADCGVAHLWTVAVSPSAKLGPQARSGSLFRLLAGFVATFVVAQFLVLFSWWMIGRGALSGHLELGWQQGWALVVLSSLPFSQLSTWLQGRFSIAAGRIIKTRLLSGSMSLNPDALKHEGIGHHIGRVVESDAFELLALSGLFVGILALLQLAAVGLAVALSRGVWPLFAAALAATAWTAWTTWSLWCARRTWSERTLRLTHDAVERIAGNRTRQLQCPEALWHNEEDRDLAAAAKAAARMDRADVALRGITPRGFLVAGLLSLLPAVASGPLQTPVLAVGFGAVLLGYQGFHMLTQSLAQLVHAGVSWGHVRDLFQAGAMERPHEPPVVAAADPATPCAPEGSLLEARDLAFHYEGRNGVVFSDLDLSIGALDRILVLGPPGGGKSTLAAVLAGLRRTRTGTVLLEGLDLATLGDRPWRQRVVLVPQFHDNHVFSASLAFNLLVGRRWPAHDEDYRAAEQVCRGLGLGELVDRMPGGLVETVGESGWRLSHGERSRVFLARAILQQPRLLIVDESLGALDPQNVLRCLKYVNQQPCAVVVISHP